MKKVLVFILCLCSAFCFTVSAAKKTAKKDTKTTAAPKEVLPKVVEGKDKVTVYVFHKDGCPYCQAAITYINSLTEKYGDYFTLVDYEVYDANWKIEDEDLFELMNTVGEKFNTEVNGVPYIVIGDKYNMNGYDEATTGSEIKTAILEAYTSDEYKDVVAEVKAEIDARGDAHANDIYIILGILAVVIGGIVALVICSRGKKAN